MQSQNDTPPEFGVLAINRKRTFAIVVGPAREERIRNCVRRLSSLSEGPRALLEVVGFGREAIGPLAGLLHAAPSIHPEPRCWAAEALGLIGGAEAIEALCQGLFINDVRAADPTVRLAEEVIRNRVAEELAWLQAPQSIEPLLRAFVKLGVAKAAVALGQFKVRRAIPHLIERLEDDFAREVVEQALRRFGREVVGALARSLQVKKMGFDAETPQSVKRRVAAIRLIAELDDRWRALKNLRIVLSDAQESVQRAAGLALLKRGQRKDREESARVLRRFLHHSDWMVRDECAEALAEWSGKSP